MPPLSLGFSWSKDFFLTIVPVTLATFSLYSVPNEKDGILALLEAGHEQFMLTSGENWARLVHQAWDSYNLGYG